MEEWRNIEGFPGYQVSNHGRVRSFYRCDGYGGGGSYNMNNPPKLLSTTRVGDGGHLRVFLYRDGKRHAILVHRLVASAFVPNPNYHPVVRHADDDPTNNYADNLRWGTQRDNVHDCIRGHGMNYDGMIAYNENRKTPVVAYNLETREVCRFDSQSEAARALRVSQGNIWRSLKTGMPARGYVFEIEEGKHEQ